MLTVYITTKRIEELKQQERYREALKYIQGVIEAHRSKSGPAALFKNEMPLQRQYEELKMLRVGQCISRARVLLETVPLTPIICQEVLILLKESQNYQNKSEARVMLNTAMRHLQVADIKNRVNTLTAKRELVTARDLLLSIGGDDPEVKASLADISEKLATCSRIREQISADIDQDKFADARRGLERIRLINIEDPIVESFLDIIQIKEQALALVQKAVTKLDANHREPLDKALSDLKQAEALDPERQDIESLRTSIKTRLVEILCDLGERHQNQAKDILSAMAAYQEAVELGLHDSRSRDAKHRLAALQHVEQQIKQAYQNGKSAGDDLETALESFETATAFGYRYHDLEQRHHECKGRMDHCRKMVDEARQTLTTDADRAVALLQEALIAYPAYGEATALLARARHQKKFQDALFRAEQALSQTPFSLDHALSGIEALEQLDAGHASLASLKARLSERANQQLDQNLKRLMDDRRLTEAVKRARAVKDRFEVSDALKKMVQWIEAQENAARKAYQDAFQKIKQARQCAIDDQHQRVELYEQVKADFEKALKTNLDLRTIVDPELKDLTVEIREWRALLAARRQFDEGDYAGCLKQLEPFQAKPILKETATLIMDAMNQMGFSGRFSMSIDGKTYVVFPDDQVSVGRNTSAYKENQIALNLPEVSRKHGIIRKGDACLYYQDRPECSHGTKRNGAFMEGQCSLKHGDRLSFGFFREEDGSPTQDEPATQLAVSLHPPKSDPTLRLDVMEVDHPDFCESTQNVYLVMGARLTIGRAKDNAIRLASSSLAGRHLAISMENNRYWVEDLGSPGGSFVNGSPLTSRRVLNLGDRLRMGSLEVVIDPYEKALDQ